MYQNIVKVETCINKSVYKEHPFYFLWQEFSLVVSLKGIFILWQEWSQCHRNVLHLKEMSFLIQEFYYSDMKYIAVKVSKDKNVWDPDFVSNKCPTFYNEFKILFNHVFNVKHIFACIWTLVFAPQTITVAEK